MSETLVIGVGGVGVEVARRLRERLGAAALEAGGGEVRFLLLDTDRTAAEASGGETVVLTATAALLDAAYRAPERFHAEWVERDVLRGAGNVEQGARGSRMLGRFLFLLPENRDLVASRLGQWLADTAGAASRRVFVVAGAGGGTGGAVAADLGYLLRQSAGQTPVESRAILLVPPHTEADAGRNAFAALTELHYYADPRTLYSAHLSGEEPYSTREAPFQRVSLLTSLDAEGNLIPLSEQQDRASIYLLTACGADAGTWARERESREGAVAPVDPDGNPQRFGTFGTEWVEYPEERLVRAVYRNLVRRSVASWLHGEHPPHLQELHGSVPLTDPQALAERVTGQLAAARDGSGEGVLRPVRTRLPWIHRAPVSQWQGMDAELEEALREAVGTPPASGRPGKGPAADRTRELTEQALDELRRRSAEWMEREEQSLDRTGRVLLEAAAELRTVSDPAGEWQAARDAIAASRLRLITAVGAARRDPFLIPWRGTALRALAKDYERVAAASVAHTLRMESLPFLRELRASVEAPLRIWGERARAVASRLGAFSSAWADQESSLLEWLRREEEEGRLALGLLRLPGRETPFVAHSGWRLPFCRPEDERDALRELRKGWVEWLVRREDGLLAMPGRSLLDAAPAERDAAAPAWLAAGSAAPAAGPERAAGELLQRIDLDLFRRLEDRLRGWLSASAFQRLAEQYRDPMELEYRLRTLVNGAAALPGLEPPHARPAGMASEYELVFFSDAKANEVPKALALVVEGAGAERSIRLAGSRAPQYLTALAEHPGFSLARCPAFIQLAEAFEGPALREVGTAFSRADLPWYAAGLVSRTRLRDASDALFLGLAFGYLHTVEGVIPLPPSLVPADELGRRMPLPAEWDRAVRQLAGDLPALQAASQAADRTVQSRGVEWCALQIERAVRGEGASRVTFPGVDPSARERALRLAAVAAAARYDELLEEYARTPAAQETEWLRRGETYLCPECENVLGAQAEALPGLCGNCRTPLLPARLVGAAPTDGFRRIPNPYVVGTPLESGAPVFVGREDIIQNVRERLIRPAQRTILILIGERRSGKTSALKQLQYRLTGDLTPLFIDLQGLTATDLPGFVWWLAWRMKDALAERGVNVELPGFAEFSQSPPDYQFETVILPEVRRKLGGGRVLLMLDEFEVLAQRVMKGTFDSRAFDYLRHLMQHSEGIEFLFSGTHILRQFAANYVTFLFNIGVFLNVDFLRPQDAVALVEEPVRSAGVTYDEEALQAVLELAGAHPYFTQMFGFHLVERLNRLRKRNVTRDDVEAESGPVIAAAGAHLDHVWGQLEAPERLLISFFAEQCPRGETRWEDDLLQSAAQDDPSLRPYVFRAAVEKLNAVGLLRLEETEREGRRGRMLGLTAEVYRQWLQTAHPYHRLREEGLAWG
ncbi:MAG: tubulin-like doman-containing protein [Armatimonadota bacterium]